jgi:hypothetical protein
LENSESFDERNLYFDLGDDDEEELEDTGLDYF